MPRGHEHDPIYLLSIYVHFSGQFFLMVLYNKIVQLAPVVQTLDSAIHRINHYPVDKY